MKQVAAHVAFALVTLAACNYVPLGSASTVSCGAHDSSSCEECPQGHGSSWCNGDCQWDEANEECIALKAGCGNVTALPPSVRQVLKAKDDRCADVALDPDSQHVPLNPRLQNLRPPPPRLPKEENRTIFMGTVSFRDGYRCGKTLFTALSRAKYPERIRLGVVDQVHKGDLSCLNAYCKMARKKWPNSNDGKNCPYRSNIRIDKRDAKESRGPSYARHFRQLLIRDEEFCMQVDSHTIFTNDWDTNLIDDWYDTDNEMAVLTTYPHDVWDHMMAKNGDNKPPTGLPHNCDVKRGGYGFVRMEQSSIIENMFRPQMTSLWGGGLVFSKCHAERRVPVDSHTQWMFDGEEYMRAALLWMSGYDMYTPTGKGHVIYHNYTSVPAKYFDLPVDKRQRQKEEEMGVNRIKLHMEMEFKGMVDTRDLKRFSGSRVRHLDSFLNFSGVSYVPGHEWQKHHTCYQLHWVPYDHPEKIEALLPGWKLTGNVSASTKCPRMEPFDLSFSETVVDLGHSMWMQTIASMCGLTLLFFSFLFARESTIPC